MKRILILACALCLLLLPVSAEETAAVKPAPCGVYQPASWGQTWVAPAAPLGDGLLLTSWAAMPRDKEGLFVSDGEKRRAVKAVIPDEDGILALILCEPGEAFSGDGFFHVMPRGTSVKIAECSLLTGDGREVGVLDAVAWRWMDVNCYVLTPEERVPLGSLLTTGDGKLAGIVAAAYAEGPNRVVAVSPEEISDGLLRASLKLTALEGVGDTPEGITVILDGNLASVDWSGMALPEKKEGETLYLVVADAGNSYLTYVPAEGGAAFTTLLLEPGRVYLAGITACAGSPDTLPDSFVLIVPDPAEPVTENSFEPILTAVAEMPPDAPEGTAPVPVTEVTEELLRSGSAYFYSSSCYVLDGEQEERTLLVTLTDPAGVSYRYESMWLYEPSLMEEDTWYVSLDETGLTEFLNRDGYPAGTYEMAYYIGGKLADSFIFELK